MLSLHELSTLILVSSAPDQIEPRHADVAYLVEHRLVAWQTLPSGQLRPHITKDGASILALVAREQNGAI